MLAVKTENMKADDYFLGSQNSYIHENKMKNYDHRDRTRSRSHSS